MDTIRNFLIRHARKATRFLWQPIIDKVAAEKACAIKSANYWADRCRKSRDEVYECKTQVDILRAEVAMLHASYASEVRNRAARDESLRGERTFRRLCAHWITQNYILRNAPMDGSAPMALRDTLLEGPTGGRGGCTALARWDLPGLHGGQGHVAPR